MIKIFCDKADAILKETQTLTDGMTTYPTVQLEFADSWNGFAKAAVVRAGAVYKSVVIQNNSFVVPYECLENSGVSLIVGVWGQKDNITIPTIWCAVGEILPGTDYEESDNVGEATPTLVEQMLAIAEDAHETAEAADQAVFRIVTVIKNHIDEYGTADVSVTAGELGDEREIIFTFSNLKGKSIKSIIYSTTASGTIPRGNVQVKLDDDTVYNFTGITEAMDAMEELIAEIEAAEAVREENEETREENEATRVSNETSRISAESGRVSAESGRVSAESGRVSAESERVTAETSRASAETARDTAETARASAETTRQNQEYSRQTSEATRTSAESTRVSNENARIVNETSRGNAETSRINAETNRATAEAARAVQETNRQTNESLRESAESGRQTYETDRRNYETARRTQETLRKNNEEDREEAEQGRYNAEAARVSAEEARVAAEEARVEEFDEMFEYARSSFVNDTLVLSAGAFTDTTLVI